MATTLLTNEKMFLENIPRPRDVNSMRELLVGVGVEIEDLTKSPTSLGLKCEKLQIQRRHMILFENARLNFGAGSADCSLWESSCFFARRLCYWE